MQSLDHPNATIGVAGEPLKYVASFSNLNGVKVRRCEEGFNEFWKILQLKEQLVTEKVRREMLE